MPLTDAEMARRLDCDRKLVARYRGRGMPMTSPAAARRWIAANVRSRAKNGEGEAEPAKPAGYQQARIAREQAEAERAQLQVLELKGTLVHREKVHAELARRLAGLRDGLLQVPARLQSVLAAETDEAKCHDLVQDELYLVLAQFSEVA